MPERAEELYARAQAAAGADGRLPMPPVGDWETFPFEGDIRVRPLEPPVAEEPARRGEDAADCWRCNEAPKLAIWSDSSWYLMAPESPTGLPVVVTLAPREHLDLGDLDEERAAELGRMLVRVEAAVRSIGEIGRVHVCRWGDGSEHFHVWFMARPARLSQLVGSFAAIWDDILPPLPEDVWRANLDAVARTLAERV